MDSVKPWSDPADTTPVRKDHVSAGDYAKVFAKFTPQEWQELLRAYCAGTSFMDAQLGRLLDALDKGKLWDKTLIIFVGDHGYHTGERRWWNKNTLFERSCRAPLIIAAPGMKGGQTTRSLIEFVDLYPTIADFCGLKIPHRAAGASLRPILADPTVSIKDAAFTLLVRNPNLHAQSIRTARWRFTLWNDGQTELFDHDADPEELHNVSVQHPAVIAELTARFHQLPKQKSN
jgi:uncharacterized sulfatase